MHRQLDMMQRSPLFAAVMQDVGIEPIGQKPSTASAVGLWPNRSKAGAGAGAGAGN